jgi:hypothetical protein
MYVTTQYLMNRHRGYAVIIPAILLGLIIGGAVYYVQKNEDLAPIAGMDGIEDGGFEIVKKRPVKVTQPR